MGGASSVLSASRPRGVRAAALGAALVGVLAGAAALGLSSGMSLAASVSAAAQPPGYLDADGKSFGVASNGLWRATAAGKPTGVKTLLLLQKGSPTGTVPEDHALVWSATCTADAQTLRLSRTIDVPGPPARVSASFGTPTAGWSRSIRSAELLVNGRLLWSAGGALGSGLATFASVEPGVLNAFKFGANTLELRVTKSPSPKAVPRCNTGSPSTRVGIAFSLSGYFEADLAIAKTYTDSFFKAGPARIIYSIPVRNNGPSGVLTGRFEFSVSGVSSVSSAVPAGPGTAACTIARRSDVNIYDVVCPLAGMPAGATAMFTIEAHVSYPPGFAVFRVGWFLGVLSPIPDPKPDNNGRYWVTDTFCAPGAEATYPKCAGAKSP